MEAEPAQPGTLGGAAARASGTEAAEPPISTGHVSALPARAGRKRPGTLSLQIRLESRPDDLELGRLIENTVWINDAHPAYQRAVAARSEGYHIALAVAAALAPLTVEPAHTQHFINAFLARWGLAGIDNGRRRGR